MKNYSKPVSVIANIFQCFLWIGTALLACVFVYSFVSPEAIELSLLAQDGSLNILGTCAEHLNGQTAALRTLIGYGAIALGLSAMVARNITLISRSLTKEPEFGEANTPFTPDNVRRVREIGLFCVSISIWGLVATWVCFGVSGGTVETSWSEMSLWLGLVVLWLSTIFAYGHRLQSDVEGLV